ncbi:MAG: hypothetical protein WCS43_19475, partial [Verrucomicrobiota bacterium]
MPDSTPAIGTFVHESGHLICDFPDLYDFGEDGQKSAGLGSHCLMAAGSLNNNERTPAPINLYLKDRVGWTQLTILTPDNRRIVSLPAVGNQGVIIKKPGSEAEFFVIENRGDSDRWAAHCPDKGIAIWHVDEAIPLTDEVTILDKVVEFRSNERQQMTTAQHYRVSLEQADGRYDLENANLAIPDPPPNLGDSGDLFDQSDGIFNSFTGPNSHWWDGSASNIIVEVLSPASASMSVRFGPDFGITPTDGLVSSGQAGGPFSPASKTYNFTGASTVCFISMSASWIDVRNSSGAIMDPATPLFIDPGVNTTFTVSINSNANNLPAGSHFATITIEGPGDPIQIPVRITVGSPPSPNSGTYGGFTYQWTVTQNGSDYTGTAVFTAYSGSGAPESIPHSVPAHITINPDTPSQEYRWVTCSVKGFSDFTLYSNAQWIGDVNIIGSFN